MISVIPSLNCQDLSHAAGADNLATTVYGCSSVTCAGTNEERLSEGKGAVHNYGRRRKDLRKRQLQRTGNCDNFHSDEVNMSASCPRMTFHEETAWIRWIVCFL